MFGPFQKQRGGELKVSKLKIKKNRKEKIVGNKKITYVDTANKDLLGVTHQINFIIDIMGGYDAKLEHETENLRSFLGNIIDQINNVIVFIADSQRADQAGKI